MFSAFGVTMRLPRCLFSVEPKLEYNIKAILIMCTLDFGLFINKSGFKSRAAYDGTRTVCSKSSYGLPNSPHPTPYQDVIVYGQLLTMLYQTPFSGNCHGAVWSIFVIKSSITSATGGVYHPFTSLYLILRPQHEL